MAKGPTFRLFGIPVRVDPTFLLIVAVLGLTFPLPLLLAWIVVVFVSVLVHELGHALAFRAYGHQASVVLYGMGGLTTGARLSPGRNLVVSLAGPLSGLVLLGLPAVAISQSVEFTDPYWLDVVNMMVFVNVFWSMVNLLPVLPLDGGNVTESLIHLATGRDAERPTRILSVVVAGAGALFALYGGYPFGVLLGGLFVFMNWSALSRGRQSRSAGVLAHGQQAMARGDTRRAIELGETVLAGRPGADAASTALELQLWAWLAEGNVANARLTVARYPSGRQPPATAQGALALAEGRVDEGLGLLTFGFANEPPGADKLFAAVSAARAGQEVPLARELLRMDDGRGLEAATVLASLLHHARWFDAAAAVGNELYRDGRAPRARTAYDVARSTARAGRLDDSLGWLRAAIDQGWTDAERVAHDDDLAAVRARPEFLEVRTRLAHLGA